MAKPAPKKKAAPKKTKAPARNKSGFGLTGQAGKAARALKEREARIKAL